VSIVQEENPLFEDVIVVTSMTKRNVNTNFGAKDVFDVFDERGRKFGTFREQLATQMYALAFDARTNTPTKIPIRVRFREKPSKNPDYPPNLSLESAEPAEAQAMLGQPRVPAADGAVGAAQGFQPAPPSAPSPAAAAAVQAIPTAQRGMAAEERLEIARSVAVKSAAWIASAQGLDMSEGGIDFWRLVQEMTTFIETGNDPIPSSASAETEAEELYE
jgi:hypothetical protein